VKPLFADTHFFLALLNRRDAAQRAAVAWYERLSATRIVTTSFVLLEVADGMSDSDKRKTCAAFLSQLLEHKTIRLVGDVDSLLWRGFDLYRSRPDKEWSLTDCTSFVAMTDDGLAEALTGDRHFEQAGFTALLTE
jgi:predicted nucleic acid-binding protein